MTRSLKKPPFIDESLLRAMKRDQKLAEEAKQKGKKFSSVATKTWARETIITEEMVGYRFRVHNGKE
jgi:ribosomal protein S19